MERVIKTEPEKRLRATSITEGKVEPFPGGGFLTYFDDQKYPIHGIPTDEGMWIAEVLKKYLVSWLVFFSNSPQRYFFVILSPFLFFFFRKMARQWLDEFARYIDGVANKLFKPHIFSPAVRHLFDVCIELWGDLPIREEFIKHNEELKKTGSIAYQIVKEDGMSFSEADRFVWSKRDWIIFGLCIFLEQDKGYRWPWQDIMMCVKKDQLILHPAREMVRLVDIYCIRDQRVHYRKLGWVVKFFLWTQPKIRKMISRFAERADFTKFQFDNYDLWGAAQSQVIDGYNYAYGGWTKEEMSTNFAKM